MNTRGTFNEETTIKGKDEIENPRDDNNNRLKKFSHFDLACLVDNHQRINLEFLDERFTNEAIPAES
uniref:Uncharacterized protein n=1 Tax=Romanomermis culicivorax TaxID=13658 RepID=A0A915IX97_ROMCU